MFGEHHFGGGAEANVPNSGDAGAGAGCVMARGVVGAAAGAKRAVSIDWARRRRRSPRLAAGASASISPSIIWASLRRRSPSSSSGAGAFFLEPALAIMGAGAAPALVSASDACCSCNRLRRSPPPWAVGTVGWVAAAGLAPPAAGLDAGLAGGLDAGFLAPPDGAGAGAFAPP